MSLLRPFTSREGLTAPPGLPEYPTFRHWVEEREAIRLKKEAGHPRPWTDDPILAHNKFCNVRRSDDKVSTWIQVNVVTPYCDHPNLPVMLAACRFINWPDTLQAIMEAGAWLTTEAPDWERLLHVLEARAQRKDKVWGGAYVIPAISDKQSPYYRATKPIQVVRGVLRDAFWAHRAEIIAALVTQRTEIVHRVLRGLRHGWGPFTAGQVVADLVWTPWLRDAVDLRTWAPLGPGSAKGLNRLAGRPEMSPLSQAQAVREMITLWEYLKHDLPWVDTLTLHDVQNICCEVSKYLRVSTGQGRMKAKYGTPVPGPSVVKRPGLPSHRDSITVDLHGTPHTIQAWRFGPLAVHRSVAAPGWTITHIPSGAKVLSRIRAKDDAVSAIDQLLPLLDWRADTMLPADLKQVRPLLVQIPRVPLKAALRVQASPGGDASGLIAPRVVRA